MCFTGSQIKPALKGEVGFALAKAGGVEKESRFAWYRQPLSQTFGLPAPRPGSLLVDIQTFTLSLPVEGGGCEWNEQTEGVKKVTAPSANCSGYYI